MRPQALIFRAYFAHYNISLRQRYLPAVYYFPEKTTMLRNREGKQARPGRRPTEAKVSRAGEKTGAAGAQRRRQRASKPAKGDAKGGSRSCGTRQGPPAPRLRRGAGGAKSGRNFHVMISKHRNFGIPSACRKILRRRQRNFIPPPAPRRLVEPWRRPQGAGTPKNQ